MTAAVEIDALRDELATAARILDRHGLIGMFGHISSLQPENERIFIHPGAGFRKDRCRPADVLDLSLNDEWKLGLPLELYMHTEMHRLFPQVRSLVHVHAPALVQVGLLREIPGDALVLNAGFWPDRVPVYEVPDLVRDRATAVTLANIMGTENVCLLRWHGAMIAAPTVRQAVVRAIHAEENARLLLAAMSHGREILPLPARGEARRALYDVIAPPRHLTSYWQYESSLVELAPERP